MASELSMKSAIEGIVGVKYSAWTIGVTNGPASRRVDHGNPSNWHQWDADTEKVARDVEKYFLDKGMKGSVGGGGHADYVYIF